VTEEEESQRGRLFLFQGKEGVSTQGGDMGDGERKGWSAGWASKIEEMQFGMF